MRGNEFLDKMELADPAYVEAADAEPEKKKRGWVKWAAAAACLLIVVTAGVFARRGDDVSRVSFGGITRDYKNVHVTGNESAIEWPWEYKTVYEQYTAITLNGREFSSSGRAIDSSLLGESVGSCDAVGFDTYTGQEYRMTAEVSRITGVSEDLMVAVKLDGRFYVFKYNEYDPPANFGEVLDDYSLSDILSLDRFTVYDGHTGKGHYSLADDGYIWDVLYACRDAGFIEDDAWSRSERNYISFTVTSDALGVYKRVFYVTSDGYIKTNIFGYAYIFMIGEDAAGRIIYWATENGTEAEEEPYTSSLAGTLVEIADGYILVDDSVLCSDKKDGMVFRIPAEDLRISRCIDFGNIGVGDIVVVDFTGSINIEAGNVVEGACSLSEGTISDGGVSVAE